MTKKIKALLLFSGGLDSILAVKILQVQGIEVTALCFSSNFFDCAKAIKSAEQLKIKIITKDISKKELILVKNPPSGYGKNMNPCIDCHANMMKQAGKIAAAENYSIVASGEVLGQRPFSQNARSLKKVADMAGVEILRPLSAKKLAETSYEKQGLVNRRRLFDISGRSRERQLELVEHFKIKYFPSPAGGCLLTDPGFSERLLKLITYYPDCDTDDVEMLKYGRIFWFKLDTTQKQNHVLLIIGRNQEDNLRLEKLAKSGTFMVQLKEIMGPTSILRFFVNNNNKDLVKEILLDIPVNLRKSKLSLGAPKSEKELIKLACLLTGYYATKARGQKTALKIKKIK